MNALGRAFRTARQRFGGVVNRLRNRDVRGAIDVARGRGQRMLAAGTPAVGNIGNGGRRAAGGKH